MLVVLTTTPGFSEGSELAEKLVEAKLVACVQIIPQITSVYVWKGKVQKENEQLLSDQNRPKTNTTSWKNSSPKITAMMYPRSSRSSRKMFSDPTNPG
jgi:uncharacterized protein involved in tolerance to divalent cations